MISKYNSLIHKKVEVICSNGNRLTGIYNGYDYDEESGIEYLYVQFSSQCEYELSLDEIISMKEI